MKISLSSIKNSLYWIIFSLSFFGFYFVILLLFNIGLGDFTRNVSILFRIIIGITLLTLFILNSNYLVFTWQLGIYAFVASLYITRILIDYYNEEEYYLSTSNNLFYFLSFSILPFITLITARLSSKYLISIFNSLLVTGLVFSVMVIFIYGRFFGKVGRLTNYSADDKVISPLILSYSSVLVLGVCIIYFLNNKSSKRKKIIGILSVSLAIIPFFLGASRGSLVALIIPFILYSVVRQSKVKSTLALFFTSIFFLGLVYLESKIGSGLFDRFFGISDALNSESTSTTRIFIWEDSLKHIMDNPFIGDRLRIDNWDSHPHNIIIEVLKTMGVIGLVPFMFLIFNAFKTSFKIFKFYPQYAWVPVIFIQSFIRNLFSGSLTNASWFWLSLALLISTNEYLKNNLLNKDLNEIK